MSEKEVLIEDIVLYRNMLKHMLSALYRNQRSYHTDEDTASINEDDVAVEVSTLDFSKDICSFIIKYPNQKEFEKIDFTISLLEDMLEDFEELNTAVDNRNFLRIYEIAFRQYQNLFSTSLNNALTQDKRVKFRREVMEFLRKNKKDQEDMNIYQEWWKTFKGYSKPTIYNQDNH